MAFPVFGTQVDTDFAASVTSMAVSLPASISSGDLLLAFSEVRNAGTWTEPSGWTELDAQLGGSSVGELTVHYKIADGTEGTTATWTASAGTTAAWHTVKITGWHGTTVPEVTKSSGDFSTQPNPPSLTPSWGSADTLWVEVAGNTATANLTTGGSTGYSGYALNIASSGGAQCNLASAYRQVAAATEDPGEMANAGSIRYWAAMTIGVRPSAGGGGSPPANSGLLSMF
ncbi:MAG: hypothetical protein ACR2FM_05000 [Candidatus Saccharimonadales bacterium]